MIGEMKRSFYTGPKASLKEFWEEKGRTGAFESGYNIRLEGITKIVERIAELIDRKLVLDIGCGPGIVASLFRGNTDVVGLDFSNSMLRSAKTRILRLVRGNAFDLPFRNEAFEAATCLFVTSDYSAKMGVFSEAYRVLEENGVFLFADYSPNDQHWTLKRKIRPLLGESCNIFIESKESLQNKLGRSGFEVRKTELISFSPEFELNRYLKSEKEAEQLRQADPSLWQHVQHLMQINKITREFILLISSKIC